MEVKGHLKWFQEDVLPILIKNGHLSEKEEIQSLEKCEFEEIDKAVNSFASVPSFGNLVLNTSTGQVSLDIIIKFQNLDPVFREKMKLNLQFQNEVTMYTRVLPSFAEFLTHCNQSEGLIKEIVPKCYYAVHNAENPEKSILIMEDLRTGGYKLSTSVTELDLQHCLVSFERIAQFHAISYAMKFQNWKNFNEIKDSFVPVWFEDDETTKKQCEDFIACCSTRGIDFLASQKDSEVPLQYLELLKKMLEPSSLFDLLRSLRYPNEPLSVICHGDFNRNNVLYKYNNEEPIDAKLFDFQTSFYGSPCLDLCFFIYMNTTLEFREKHFDHVFAHYYSSLIKRISLILIESEENISQRLPFEVFKKDFARVSITAYVTAAFFLPVMMTPAENDFEKDMKEKTFKEMALENILRGGEVVSKRVSEIIVDFYRRKFYV